jgi:hypothetical protein
MSVSIINNYVPYLIEPEISTGNIATVNDAYSTTKSAANPYGTGAKNMPGAAFYVADSAGRILKCRYVRINPTVAPSAYIVGPVYWQDAARTTVTILISNSYTADPSSMAGILMNAQATPSVLTGNWVVIVTRGYLAAVAVCALTAKGDELFGVASGGTSDQLFDRVATGTAPKFPGHDCRALTNVATGVSDIWAECEGA